MRYINDPLGLIELLALPYIERVNIQMLATEVTENTKVFSFVERLYPRTICQIAMTSRLKPLLRSQ